MITVLYCNIGTQYLYNIFLKVYCLLSKYVRDAVLLYWRFNLNQRASCPSNCFTWYSRKSSFFFSKIWAKLFHQINVLYIHCQNQKISSYAVSKSKSESGGLMYVHIKSHSVHYRVAGFFYPRQLRHQALLLQNIWKRSENWKKPIREVAPEFNFVYGRVADQQSIFVGDIWNY